MKCYSFYYPKWTDNGYTPEIENFLVCNENYEEIISKPNPIDFLCETMELVSMDNCKESRELPLAIVNLNKRLEDFNDFFSWTIIELFSEETDKLSLNVDSFIKKIKEDSWELTDTFIKLSRTLWAH